MMILIISILVAQVVWAEKADFYHGQAIEFKPPTQLRNNSYFGFSTTYDRYNKKMIISAPTENENGTVYECNIGSKHCTELYYKIARYAPSLYKHDYWFGATVAAGSTFTVACVPRLTKIYTREINKEFFNMAGTFGQCYMRMKNDTQFSKLLKTPSPTSNLISVERTMETLGWSLDIADNDALIVGGPGMYETTGLAATYSGGKNYISLERIKDIKATFNFGYSVATGYFIDENHLGYAVGSTYGRDGTGEVYFYVQNQDRVAIQNILKKGVDDLLIGSMFGATLCAANLHKSKKNKPMDLLVGAPTYAIHNSYNTGAVYVYIHKLNNRKLQFQRRITCQKPGAYFGSAIVTVGDLNGDGHDDIAIGAPYEDEVGAVYLYSGAELISDKSEKNLAHLQKIAPSGGYHSFGLSLSVLRDHDNNGCNELAVGAPFDDRVLVYSCMAAITITKITVDFPKLQNHAHNQELFKFSVCIHMKYPENPKNIVADISADVSLKHIYAYLSRPNKANVYTFAKNLRDKQAKYCEDVDFILPKDGKYGVQIRYDVSTKLLNNPMKLNFDSTRVVLSDTSEFYHTGAVSAADCAGGNECKPILDMHISSNIGKPFIIGSKEMETFRIDVHNVGEIAYDPCIHLKVDTAILYQPPTDCVEMQGLDGVYECTYRKPLRNNETWSIDNITLNLKGLTNQHSNFTIKATLFNHCITINHKSNKNQQTKTYVVDLESHYEGVDIKGTTNIGDVINMNKEGLRDGKQFEHIYTITNNGLTNFEKLTTVIDIIKKEFMTFPDMAVSSHKENKHKAIDSANCETKYDEIKLIAECTIDNLPKTHFFKIRIAMKIKPDYLVYDNLLKENVTQTSKLTLKIDSFKNSESITTTIRVQETAVALWIIILSVLVGILLIVILIIALSLCGCLTRHKKKQLNDLKERVKRESIRRSMRHAPQHDNTRQILVQEMAETQTTK